MERYRSGYAALTIVGLIFAIIGVLAISRGYAGYGYIFWLYVLPVILSLWVSIKKGRWLLGLILGLVLGWIGFIVCLILPPSKSESENRVRMSHRECPHCKEMMRRDATVCPHCQRDVIRQSL